MRIGVISDSHGLFGCAVSVVNNMGDIEALIHAGDFYDDAIKLSEIFNIPVYTVPGNCDISCEAPQELIVNLDGCKILITHGHLYHVKNTLRFLYNRAQEANVQMVLFGHTHEPLFVTEKDICFFNPGSLLPTIKTSASYGILNVSSQGITGELLEF